MRAALALVAALSLATAGRTADLPTTLSLAQPAASQSLNDGERSAYRRVFAALRARDWAGASALLDTLPIGPLTSLARAELLLGNSLADGASAAALAAAASDLPEAPGLLRLARAKGALDPIALPEQHALVRAAGPSKRVAARPTRGDLAGVRLAARTQPLFRANDGLAAETLIEAVADTLAPETLTELRQRTAWAYFLAGDDASAQRVATLARGGTGDWAVQAAWVAGLAGWRLGDFGPAAEAFANVAAHAHDAETVAAGLFWAARCDGAAGNPDRAGPRLRTAARMGETFYGMLASAALGGELLRASASAISLDRPNVRAAAALIEIGETALADQLLRHQARIGPAAEHGALIRIAGQLGLPETQLWLAGNVPAGTDVATDARYPMPAWTPAGGWRVDSALLYAHALQESQFRIGAVSPAGARGLMQLMPGTARMVARHKGMAAPAMLDDPATSLEYGQSYLEELADNAGTGGLLPKVIAAYNAGPNNVALWNLRPKVQADPLLFIEAIPFAETRAYVAIVLRNYWMYQRQTGAETTSLTALAGGQWPRFPTRTLQTAGRSGGGETTANR